MKIKELIIQLQEFDPELDIKVTSYDDVYDPIAGYEIDELNIRPYKESGYYLDISIYEWLLGGQE